MPKHMRFPRSCDECLIRCDNAVLTPKEQWDFEYDYEFQSYVDEFAAGCLLIETDELGMIDWEANGWPEITPFFGCEDTSNMPEFVSKAWYCACDACEQWWEKN